MNLISFARKKVVCVTSDRSGIFTRTPLIPTFIAILLITTLIDIPRREWKKKKKKEKKKIKGNPDVSLKIPRGLIVIKLDYHRPDYHKFELNADFS